VEHLPSLPELAGLLVTFCSLSVTWTLYRVNRWLRKHLANERQRELQQIERDLRQQNETLRILSEASESGGQPTLEGLLRDERRDFSLESSQPPSSRDWSDDNEMTTTLPETPRSKKRGTWPPR
jgi:hypothetical protein